MPVKDFVCRIVLLFIAVIAAILPGRSQLCTGSLGDPVVNITFGTPGNPDFNFTPPSAYTYTSGTCPNDGFYTITNTSTNCFGGTWHTVPADHTGGGSAYMLVNASYTPGDFFVATVSNLCPSTTYEFASWVMNVMKPAGILPDLTFKVETTDGILLNQFNTGGIPSTAAPQWNQYGFFFTTGAATQSIVLRITNNAPGGIGNDLALDDITFRPCGPEITSEIRGSSDKVDLCVNEQSDFTFDGAVSAGYTSPVFQWQVSTNDGQTWTDIAGANSLTHVRQPTTAGNYLYRLAVAEAGNAGIQGCRISSNTLTITVHDKPIVEAGPDRILISGSSTTLLGVVTGDTPVYDWQPPDGLDDNTLLQPAATPASDKVYKLTATSAFGCINEDYVRVKVVAGIFVPTAFTPNNDGKNDRWRIPFLDAATGASITVFNRYGQVVYKTTGTPDWDGKLDGQPQPSGTYVYLVQFPQNEKMLKGIITLIR